MQSIKLFQTQPFINALKAFFDELQVPVNYLADEPASATDILGGNYKPTNQAHQLIADVYAMGMVDDAIFEKTNTFDNLAQVKQIKADTTALEAEIDRLVCELYGLSEEEIGVVEGRN